MPGCSKSACRLSRRRHTLLYSKGSQAMVGRMGDYKKILEYSPHMQDFRINDMVAFRGDVLCYWPDIETASVTTDTQGFRHSCWRGKTMSVVECLQEKRYGIVLGPSTMFGSGIDGNEKTIPSLLAEMLDFPFANASLPGGNSRNLYTLLIGMVAGAKSPPEVVVFSNGGDLSNFCEARQSDAIFGSPNRIQLRSMRPNESSDSETDFSRVLAFSSIWATALKRVCQFYNAGTVMAHQSTFFEKSAATDRERDCALGEASHPNQEKVFDSFRTFNARFFDKRKEIAERLNMPLAGEGLSDKLSFVDEFHLDEDGARTFAGAIAEKVELALQRREKRIAKKASKPSPRKS